MSSRAAMLVGLLALLGLLAAPHVGFARSKSLGVSPHTTADGCPACHEPAAGASSGALRPIEAACKTCHPDADMHPIGMKPDAVTVPASFPLDAGTVSCASCHANPSCDTKRAAVAPYLRGGNPERKVEFCNRCHSAKSNARTSPHAAPEKGKADGTCAACHSGIPEAGAAPELARLRLDPKLSCTTCHPDAVHAGAREHLGARQEKPLSAEAARALPLGPNAQINCWTCHDVHTFGSSKPQKASALTEAIRASRPAVPAAPSTPVDTMCALSNDDGTLCRACHGDGP